MSRLLLSILLLTGCSAEGQKKGKPVLEYGENDFENLYDEWEDNDEDKLEPDELPYGHPDRPARPLDLSGMDMSDPQSIVRASKVSQQRWCFMYALNTRAGAQAGDHVGDGERRAQPARNGRPDIAVGDGATEQPH